MLSKDLNRRVKNSLIEASTDEYPTLTKEQRIAALELSVDDVTSGALARLLALEAMIPTFAAEAPTNYRAATAQMEIDTGITLNYASKHMIAEDANTIVVTLIDPETVAAATTVEVDGLAINITLKHSEAAITATLAEIKAAIEASEAASALITCTITGSTSTVVTVMPEPKTLSDGVDATEAKASKTIITNEAIWVAAKDVVEYGDGWKSVAVE